MWLHDTTEIVYEDLSTSNLALPENINLDEEAETEAIGRWGELLVKSHLVLQAQTDPSICEITWMGENGQSATPYDFIIKYKNSQDGPIMEDFIEVKSTLASSKAFFEISSQELQFAYEKREHLHLYRVFNAGKPEIVRLSKMMNLAQKLETKQIKLCMVL